MEKGFSVRWPPIKETDHELDDSEEETEDSYLDDDGRSPYLKPPRSPAHLWVYRRKVNNLLFQNLALIGSSDLHNSDSKIMSMLSKLRVPSSYESNVMVQFWAPVRNSKGRCVLTTSHQPFAFRYRVDRHLSYRIHRERDEIGITECGDWIHDPNLGPHARSFLHLVFESTPDVRHYSAKEFPLKDRAVRCGVKSLYLVPLIETSTCCCLGVLEVAFFGETEFNMFNIILEQVPTMEEFNYPYFYTSRETITQISDEQYQRSLDGIEKVLEVTCKTHRLPLAQAWELSEYKKEHLSIVKSGSNMVGKTYDSVDSSELAVLLRCYYATKDNLRGFHALCWFYRLTKGQGPVGKTLSSCNPCFCRDVSQLSITKYPLAHHAKAYGLTSCFAIGLTLNCGNFVLEFFLPPYNTDSGDPPTTLLGLLVATLKEHLRIFKVISQEMEEDLSVDIFEVSSDDKIDSFKLCQSNISPTKSALQNETEEMQARSSLHSLSMEDVHHRTHSVVGKQQRKCDISFEDFKQHCGKKVTELAEIFDVSVSTVKRKRKEYREQILLSSSRNVNLQGKVKRNQESSSRDRSYTNPVPLQEATAIVAHTPSHSTVTIKAHCDGEIYKLSLSSSSGREELVKELTERVESLKDSKFTIRYKDKDGDSVKVVIDKDLKLCMDSLGASTITLFVEPTA